MNRSVIIMLLVLSTGFSSCSVYRIYPKFTTASQLVTLRGNDAIEAAKRKLGCAPYDIYVVQKNGYSIYKWYYKREVQEISGKKLLLPEHQTDGVSRLEKNLSEAFLIFNAENGLYSILTRSGRGDLLALTLFNNDALTVQKERLDIWFDPDSRQAVGSNGVRLSYDDVIRIIDEFFDGNSDIRVQEVYGMIDHFFEQGNE